MQKNKNEEDVYVRKNGEIIYFVRFDWYFSSYLIKRFLHFLFDSILFWVVAVILQTIVKIPIWQNTLIVGFSYSLFLFIQSILFKNGKTLGMKLMRISVANVYGGEVSVLSILIRSLFGCMYFIPFIGWGLLFLSGICAILTKGTSFIDLISKTSVTTNYLYYKNLQLLKDFSSQKGDFDV